MCGIHQSHVEKPDPIQFIYSFWNSSCPQLYWPPSSQFQLLDRLFLLSVHTSTCTSNMKTYINMTLMSLFKFSPAGSTVKTKQGNKTLGCENGVYSILIVLLCRTWETGIYSIINGVWWRGFHHTPPLKTQGVMGKRRQKYYYKSKRRWITDTTGLMCIWVYRECGSMHLLLLSEGLIIPDVENCCCGLEYRSMLQHLLTVWEYLVWFSVMKKILLIYLYKFPDVVFYMERKPQLEAYLKIYRLGLKSVINKK